MTADDSRERSWQSIFCRAQGFDNRQDYGKNRTLVNLESHLVNFCLIADYPWFYSARTFFDNQIEPCRWLKLQLLGRPDMSASRVFSIGWLAFA